MWVRENKTSLDNDVRNEVGLEALGRGLHVQSLLKYTRKEKNGNRGIVYVYVCRDGIDIICDF